LCSLSLSSEEAFYFFGSLDPPENTEETNVAIAAGEKVKRGEDDLPSGSAQAHPFFLPDSAADSFIFHKHRRIFLDWNIASTHV